jgi:hypothetical protein
MQSSTPLGPHQVNVLLLFFFCPERREAIRRFWEDQYAVEYADPMVQANGGTLGIRAAALREYEALEDEERRETGREFHAIHPHTPLGKGGSSGFPFR